LQVILFQNQIWNCLWLGLQNDKRQKAVVNRVLILMNIWLPIIHDFTKSHDVYWEYHKFVYIYMCYSKRLRFR
jgi:hypothetical protein